MSGATNYKKIVDYLSTYRRKIYFSSMPQAKHTILYVEDDYDDLFIVKQAFEKYDSSITVLHAQDGVDAFKYLDQYKASGPLPCLIILDMNMPGMDGRETLKRIRESKVFADIPVVVFTTSSTQADKDFARKWGAEFVTKPLVFSELERLADTFVQKCNFEMSKRA